MTISESKMNLRHSVPFSAGSWKQHNGKYLFFELTSTVESNVTFRMMEDYKCASICLSVIRVRYDVSMNSTVISVDQETGFH